MRPAQRSVLIYYNDRLVASSYPRPIYRQSPRLQQVVITPTEIKTHTNQLREIPSSPMREVVLTATEIETDTNQWEDTPSKSSLMRRLWQILLGIFVTLVLAAAIVLPVVFNDIFQTTTKRSTTTTATVLPSQCSSYTTDTDSTRYFTYSGATNGCDNSAPFGSSTWIRFSGGAATMLAGSVVPSNRCGTSVTGWYNGTYPATGMTISGPVCFNWSGLPCSQTNSISVTNCNGFYVYLLAIPASCSYRYCTA